MSGWKATVSNGMQDGEGFEKAPAGNHAAVCVAIVDLGHQRSEYNGEEKIQHRLYFAWELVDEPMSGTKGRNHVVGIDLTYSLTEKAKLRKWIESRTGQSMADGSDYEIADELGQACMLSVVANAKGYPKVDGVGRLPKGMDAAAIKAKANHTPIAYHLSDFDDGKDLPNWLPWLYGKSLSDHIKARVSEDDRPKPAGRAPHPPSSHQHVAAPPSPPSGPKPPSAPSAGSAPKRYWADLGNGNTGEFFSDKADLYFTNNGLDENTLVMPDGGKEWKPAREYGFKAAF